NSSRPWAATTVRTPRASALTTQTPWAETVLTGPNRKEVRVAVLAPGVSPMSRTPTAIPPSESSASETAAFVRARTRASSMRTAPRSETIAAVSTGEVLVSNPRATPVNATCPIPSPSRARRRCTRKVPRVGVTRPMSTAATRARRMNSYWKSSVIAGYLDPGRRHGDGSRCGGGGFGGPLLAAGTNTHVGGFEGPVVDVPGVQGHGALDDVLQRPEFVQDQDHGGALLTQELNGF